jgi:hypothetical protein
MIPKDGSPDDHLRPQGDPGDSPDGPHIGSYGEGMPGPSESQDAPLGRHCDALMHGDTMTVARYMRSLHRKRLFHTMAAAAVTLMGATDHMQAFYGLLYATSPTEYAALEAEARNGSRQGFSRDHA